MLTVIGESLIDLVSGTGHQYTARPGGSPLNIAVGLARLGLPTQLMSRFADDAFGRQLRTYALGNGVRLDAAPHAAEPTTLAVATIAADGHAEYDFYVDGTADWQWTDAELGALPAGTSVLHTGSLAAWTPPGAARIEALVRSLNDGGGVLLSYDPNIRGRLMGDAASGRPLVERSVALSHVVKSSDEDIEFLYPGQPVEEVAERWLSTGPSIVVVTRGGAGSLALSAKGARVVQAPIAVEVVDTIGAGDSFMSGLLAGLYRRGIAEPAATAAISEQHLADVVGEAALIAALTCQRAGADPPTAAEFAAGDRRQ